MFSKSTVRVNFHDICAQTHINAACHSTHCVPRGDAGTYGHVASEATGDDSKGSIDTVDLFIRTTDCNNSWCLVFTVSFLSDAFID